MDHSSSNLHEKMNDVNYQGMEDGNEQNASNGNIIPTERDDNAMISAGDHTSNYIRHCNSIDDAKPPASRQLHEFAGHTHSLEQIMSSNQTHHNQLSHVTTDVEINRSSETEARADLNIPCEFEFVGHTHTLDQISPNYPSNHNGQISHGRADFIEAPTSQNIEQYLSFIEQGPNNNFPPELDRKPPPSNANNTQLTSRGRPRHRNTDDDVPPPDGFVPLRFVHVPNNASALLDSTKRAPSVPDLISYLHNHGHDEGNFSTLLSNETLRDKERESRKEQFEARLRRAHLRPNNSDAASSVTRYRSKSTPSRGGMWANGSHSVSGNAKPVDRQISGLYSSIIHGAFNGEGNLIHTNLRTAEIAVRPFETSGIAQTNGFHTLSSAEPNDNGFGTSPPPGLIIATSDIIPGQHDLSPVRSFDGSRRPRTFSGISSEEHAIIEPPPLPPPATEKERLVERERQARLETERARRRHIALLRDRQLEESGDVVDNEGSDNAGLLGQVSFDAGLRIAPEFVGDSAVVMDLPTGNSSVASSTSIPRPPLPPPPATERERLVERERQARLETERARRRHIALLRERQLEDSGGIVENEGSDNAGLIGQVSFDAGLQSAPEFVGDNAPTGTSSVDSLTSIIRPPLPPPPATERERLVERERQARLETERARRRHLAVQRERQLDNDIPINIDEMVHNGVDSHSLERHVHYGDISLQEAPLEGVVTTQGDGESNINAPSATSVEYTNHAQAEIHNTDTEANGMSYPMERFLVSQMNHADSDIIEPLNTTPGVRPNLDPDTSLSEIVAAPIEWGGLVNELGSSSGSVASIIASTNQESENAQVDNHRPATNSDNFRAESSWATNLASSPSHDSFNTNPYPPRLTEAEIAQLAEVEHASTGNAAPQSVRYEPSEPSIIGRGTFDHVDHAFSVATQTTMIESVTEASEGPMESAFSDIDESAESLIVIRVGSDASIQTSASGDDSDDITDQHSEGISDQLSHSMTPGSLLSSDDILPRLTEADIVTMREIDYASIGNAPPHSERDERLSESSVNERLDRQFSITTAITEMSSVDENIAAGDLLRVANSDGHDSLSNQPENDSHHSDHSIEAMPIDDSDEEDMLVYQASMGSSASIEALPSIDLDNDVGLLHHYGAINTENATQDPLAEEFSCDQDIESAPLLSVSHEGQSQTPPDHLNSNPADCRETRQKSTPNESLAYTIPLLASAVAEIPTFIIIAQGSEQLNSLLGFERYQIVLASLVVTSFILNHFDKRNSGEYGETDSGTPLPDRSYICAELQEGFLIGILLGFFVGLTGFVMSDLDAWFGTVLLFSVAAATFVSRLCKLLFVWLLLKLKPNQAHRIMWTEPVMRGFCHCGFVVTGYWTVLACS